jgi:hypothetical protein
MNGARAAVVKAFLLIEVVEFALASLLHRGLMSTRYAHARAAIAESVIALVLAAGLAVCVYAPARTRITALAAQTLALLGVCAGIVMIFIGAGPQTMLDYTIHAVLIVTWALGIAATRRVAAI